MSAVPSEIKPQQQALKANHAVIVGKVDAIRTYDTSKGKVYEHRLVLAAADEYSSPGVVVVVAERKLGGVNEPLRVLVSIGGYRRKYDNKEGETILTAQVELVAVE